MYEKLRIKVKENSNDKSYQTESQLEGLEGARDDSQYGFITEGATDKGIFLNG